MISSLALATGLAVWGPREAWMEKAERWIRSRNRLDRSGQCLVAAEGPSLVSIKMQGGHLWAIP